MRWRFCELQKVYYTLSEFLENRAEVEGLQIGRDTLRRPFEYKSGQVNLDQVYPYGTNGVGNVKST